MKGYKFLEIDQKLKWHRTKNNKSKERRKGRSLREDPTITHPYEMHDTYTKRHRFFFAHYPKQPTYKFLPFVFYSHFFPVSTTLPPLKPLSLSHLTKTPKEQAKEREKNSTMATISSIATPFLVILLLSVSSVYGASHRHAAAPAPSVDCTTLILNMAECLSFVSSGGTEAKPARACCDGLKTVLKTDAECLCEAFKSSASLGVTLNITKAATLPAACKLHAPSIANCGCKIYPFLFLFFVFSSLRSLPIL